MADTVNYLAREERIAARNSRMEARLRAKQKMEEGDEDFDLADLDGDDIGTGRMQVKKSTERVEKVKATSFQSINQVRLMAEHTSSKQAEDEEFARLERLQKLKTEREESMRKDDEISRGWAPLYEETLPENLLQAIEKQKSLCDEVLASKEAFIQEYRTKLEDMDKEHPKMLEQHGKEIDLLLERMRARLAELRKLYATELKQIEDAFTEEYSDLIEGNRDEIDLLMEKRRNQEVQFIERRQIRIEEQQEQLNHLHVQDGEDFAIIKVKLETYLQDLEQQLGEMRAVYLLNNEKLGYNVGVLRDRKKENQATITSQKKKINRQTDSLSNLKAKYHRTDREYRQKNIALTDEYRRITEQYKDLQNKYKHFEKADRNRYNEVWRMNATIATDLAKQSLEADKILHEQQLGLNWIPPDESVFELTNPVLETPSRKKGEKAVPDDAGRASALSETHPENLRKVMNLLSTEGSFLVEEKTLRILDELPHDAQELIKVDSVISALRIKDGDDLSRLISHFMEEGEDHADARSKMISADAATIAIREYLESGTEISSEGEEGKKKVKEQKERMEKGGANSSMSTTSMETRQQRKEDEIASQYWEKMEYIVPETSVAAWKALEHGLHQYNELLNDRSKLADACNNLHNQNEELKQLLNHYLTAKVNDDLQIPPMQTLTLQASPVTKK